MIFNKAIMNFTLRELKFTLELLYKWSSFSYCTVYTLHLENKSLLLYL